MKPIVVALLLLCLPMTALGAQQGASLSNASDYASKIYPVGWSKSGAFAYVYKTTWMSGIYDVGFVIIDLVEDKVLFNYVDSFIGISSDGDPLDQVSEKHKTAYRSAMDKHAIIAGNSPFLGVSFLYLGANYQMQALPTVAASNVVSYSLTLSRAGKSKRVAAEALSLPARNIREIGAFLSPYEPRAALVVGIEHANYDNKASIVPSVHGCHLRAGF